MCFPVWFVSDLLPAWRCCNKQTQARKLWVCYNLGRAEVTIYYLDPFTCMQTLGFSASSLLVKSSQPATQKNLFLPSSKPKKILPTLAGHISNIWQAENLSVYGHNWLITKITPKLIFLSCQWLFHFRFFHLGNSSWHSNLEGHINSCSENFHLFF